MALGVWLLVVVSVVSQLPLCPVQAPPRGRHSGLDWAETHGRDAGGGVGQASLLLPLVKGLVSGVCSAPVSAVASMT